MKFISKRETRRLQIDNTLHATMFDTGDKDVQLAITEINGRYPERGRLTNSRCKEVVYVLEGSGRVEVEGTPVELAAGDVIHIESGERISWLGCLKLIAICAPAWTAEQHLFVD